MFKKKWEILFAASKNFTFEVKLECLNCLNSTVVGTPSALKLFSIKHPAPSSPWTPTCKLPPFSPCSLENHLLPQPSLAQVLGLLSEAEIPSTVDGAPRFFRFFLQIVRSKFRESHLTRIARSFIRPNFTV